MAAKISKIFLHKEYGKYKETKSNKKKTRGHMALNRSPEYTVQSQTFNFEI